MITSQLWNLVQKKIKLFLNDSGVHQEDDTESRRDALLELLNYYRDEIMSKEFVLQCFYHAYHLPPSMFHLFRSNGDPTGCFCILKSENKRNLMILRKDLSLSPILVKYSLEGAII